MEDSLKLREEIIKTGILLVDKNLVQGTGGNISARTEEGFLITPSGMSYQKLIPEDIVTMDYSGKVLEGSRKPSVECNMHRMIFAVRPDISAIVHTHSTYATSVAAARKALEPITDNQIAVFGGTVPIAEYGPIGSEILARNAVVGLANGFGLLLSNHGALCVGKTLEEALVRCEMLEIFSKIFLISQLAGGGVVLCSESVRTEAEFLKKHYGQIEC